MVPLLSLSICVSAQADLSQQIKSLINNASTDFKDYKGNFLELHNKDSVFLSSMTISGTKNNDILYTEGMIIYRAFIIDSVKLKPAIKLADEWSSTLRGILGDEFKLIATKIVDYNPSKHGWKFEKEDLWINVDVYPSGPDSTFFWVAFGITQLKQL